MKNKRHITIAFSLIIGIFISSCGEQENGITVAEIEDVAAANPFTSSEFDDILSGNAIQVDNDGNGAHNFTSYTDKEGIDISAWASESGGYLRLYCPPGSGARRAEFRDYSNRSLTDDFALEIECKPFNIPSDKKVIIAQIHNDNGGVSGTIQRPYITVFIENGQIWMERTNNYNGSGSDRPSSKSQAFNYRHTYNIRISSSLNSTNVWVRVRNENTNVSQAHTFARPSAWDNSSSNGEYYFKFGVYMPDGGSTNTYNRIAWAEME